ncbi:hypothetical protein PUN28_006804 [Cardiocondyla obscurior]|uniref:Uncharacterized protein n=1 Tax=Cardiocondyla obscurior TaxID=286306 RepID=A0AAW2G008_9HYME
MQILTRVHLPQPLTPYCVTSMALHFDLPRGAICSCNRDFFFLFFFDAAVESPSSRKHFGDFEACVYSIQVHRAMMFLSATAHATVTPPNDNS